MGFGGERNHREFCDKKRSKHADVPLAPRGRGIALMLASSIQWRFWFDLGQLNNLRFPFCTVRMLSA